MSRLIRAQAHMRQAAALLAEAVGDDPYLALFLVAQVQHLAGDLAAATFRPGVNIPFASDRLMAAEREKTVAQTPPFPLRDRNLPPFPPL